MSNSHNRAYRQGHETGQRSSVGGHYDQQIQNSQNRTKKKELQKMQSLGSGMHENQMKQASYENLQKVPGVRVKSQASNGQNYHHDGGQGVAYVKQVAVKGATGRKGSLPLTYAQQNVPVQGSQGHHAYMHNAGLAHTQNRSSQQYLPANSKMLEQNVNPIQLAQNQKGSGKIIKSHAKYFSQQNSPVSKEGKQAYTNHHHQQSMGAAPGGIILSSSGAGIIGLENFQNSGNRITNEGQQTTGNFGSSSSHLQSNKRHQQDVANKNYSQVSAHSNGSQNIYKQHKQQGYPKAGQPGYSNQMRYSNSNGFENQERAFQHGYPGYPNQMQKGVGGGQGPTISPAACNQTVGSGNTIQSQNPSQQTLTQTIQNSNTQKSKLKQKYDESFLNGPLNNEVDEIKLKNKSIMQQQQMNAKRVINNQSVNVNGAGDEQMMPSGAPGHKRVLSSQQNFQGPVQRSNTSSGNYQVPPQHSYSKSSSSHQQMMAKTEYNQFKGKSSQKNQKFVQGAGKNSMDRSQELFNKSGNQLSFLNPNNIVLNAEGGRVGMKNMKRPTKAQTRPASNQKVKQMIQNDVSVGRFEGNSQVGSKSKKATQDRRQSKYNRATPAVSNQAQAIAGKYGNIQNYYQQEHNNTGSGNQNSMGNLVVGSQNLQYYAGKTSATELQSHNSQTGMPILNTNSQQHISNGLNSQILNQQQIIQMKSIASNQTQSKHSAMPKTGLHKSNKLHSNNNYVKQNTIDQQQVQAMQEYNQAQAAMHHKRLSTGNIMPASNFSHGDGQDSLSFSMKKQNFHQRAETQLKNYPAGTQYQGYDPMLLREQESLHGGANSQASFVVLPHQQAAQQVINTHAGQGNPSSSKLSQMNMNPNLKYSNSKSQKSSTSRLVNTSSTQGRYNHGQVKGSNQHNASSSNAGSTDRMPISHRHAQIVNDNGLQHQNSDNNYGGASAKNAAQGIASSSSKTSLKAKQGGQKLNTLQHGGNTSYPYQSSSTKSGKTSSAAQKNSNLSIAQIFQQKGLNYKGPSKVMINQNNSNKVQHKMGPNGVIVHTKGIGLKGSLTTSANTAQNSPRVHMNKGNMFNKNQSSLRRKPSTASIAGASIGGGQSSSSNFAVQGGNQQKKLGSSTSGKVRSQQQSNVRSGNSSTYKKTTGTKATTKKKDNQAMQYLGNLQEEQDSQYQEEVQVTEVAAYDGADKVNQLEPSKLGNYKKQRAHQKYHNTNSNQEEEIMNDRSDENINLLESEKASSKMRAHPNQYTDQTHEIKSIMDKQMQNKNFKNSLQIGAQQSSQYIADNGGTGSNPSHNQKGISQQDFYSQNIAVPSNVPHKKNQHSHSLGQIQHIQPNEAQIYGMQKPQSLAMQNKATGKQTKVDKKSNAGHNQQKIQKKGQNILKQSNKNKEKNDTEKFVFQEDEIQYRKQLQEVLNDDDYMVQGPLITEEEEQEIRQVASDINEKAFYGKVLRTKQIIQENSVQNKEDSQEKQFQKLSPRSQEIASVMKNIDNSFRKTGNAPETEITYYRIGKMLGRGAFGKVNLAMHKLVRKLVALKSLNKECLTDEVQKQKLMKEVNLLLKLRHDHVVKIYETIETKKHIIIVMELCAGGDLLNYVRKRRRLKEPFAKKIFKQIIDGLGYIHSKHIGHRDIKLDNILLDGKGSVKIGDFGVSKQCQPGVKMREQCGTPAYIAPEILKNKNGYSFNVDLWSAGVVLFAMLYGTVPFKAASMEELHSLILRGVYTLKEDISQEARDMLRGLLEINPHKRLTIEEILKHPWLKDYDESLQLFNDQEREMIKKEYTYNDPSRYNRNENEEPVDCFTEHNIDSVYNTMKNASEKSIILAPFNSTQSEDFEQFKKDIEHMMCEKNLVLRLSRLCREIDRQYEFNNNGQLDNGVYHKQINNTQEAKSDGDKDGDDKKKKDKKKADNSDDEDDESRFQIIQCSKSQGLEFRTEDYVDLHKNNGKSRDAFINNLIAGMHEEERKLIESTFGTNKEMEIDTEKVDKLVQFGYPEKYVYESLQDNLPNYVTAGYYLLQMDQNYC